MAVRLLLARVRISTQRLRNKNKGGVFADKRRPQSRAEPPSKIRAIPPAKCHSTVVYEGIPDRRIYTN